MNFAILADECLLFLRRGTGTMRRNGSLICGRATSTNSTRRPPGGRWRNELSTRRGWARCLHLHLHLHRLASTLQAGWRCDRCRGPQRRCYSCGRYGSDDATPRHLIAPSSMLAVSLCIYMPAIDRSICVQVLGLASAWDAEPLVAHFYINSAFLH